MKDILVFDTTDADTIAESDHVGAHTLAGDGSLITSGDGDSDNIANTFEGLDVRNFNYGYDATGDNWDRLQQVAGAMKVYIDDGDFEVDVVIEAEKAEDSAHSSGHIGNYVLNVRVDDITAANTAFLAGTEGDYQSFLTTDRGELWVKDQDVADKLDTIDSVLDSIKVDTGAIAVDVAAIEVELLDQGTTLDSILVDTSVIAGDTTSMDATLTGLSHNEDDAHVSGDSGIQALSVRIDDIDSPPVGTLAGTEGDYQSLHTDSKGQLYVKIAEELNIEDAALANVAIANAANTLAVASTAEDAVASPLADRKYLYIYNNDNRKMYIGASGVTEANGFPISPGSYLELRAGAAIDLEFVSPKVGHAIRTMELS